LNNSSRDAGVNPLRVRVEAYLRNMADTDRSLARQIAELLELIRQYGPEDVATAIEKAAQAHAFGADYVANILRQQRSPRRPQPPLRLRDPHLNELPTGPVSLLEYGLGYHLKTGHQLSLQNRPMEPYPGPDDVLPCRAPFRQVLLEVFGWKACQANQRVLFTTQWTC
jgi:hypothetical protein